MKREEAPRYLSRVQPALVPVAAPRSSLCCETCRSGVDPGRTRCKQCQRYDAPRVLPISMSLHGGALNHRLRGYKDAPTIETRREHSLDLAALLGMFLLRHQRCIGRHYDHVVTVPSHDRDAFAGVVDMLRGLRTRRIEATGESDAPQYELVTPQVDGKTVLLLDDTFTSGKTIAAAHRALVNGGARIIGPLVIGRHFRSDYSTSVDLWRCLQHHEWSLDACGLCGPVRCEDDPVSQSMF